MGECSDGHDCNKVIIAFTKDIIAKYRSKALDAAFGDQVRYYVKADDEACVCLYAAVPIADDKGIGEEHFRVESWPSPWGPSDSIASDLHHLLPDISEEDIERRLGAAAEEDMRDHGTSDEDDDAGPG